VSQQLGALQTQTTDTFLFISRTTNVLLFKFRCNIFNARFGSEWDTLYNYYYFYYCGNQRNCGDYSDADNDSERSV